jgi:hypothetical protein
MSYAAGHTFKAQRVYAGFKDLFSVVGYKVTRIFAIWQEFAFCATRWALLVMVSEAVGCFLKDSLIGQFFKHGLAQRRKKPYHKKDRSFGAFGLRGRTCWGARFFPSLYILTKGYLASAEKTRVPIKNRVAHSDTDQ